MVWFMKFIKKDKKEFLDFQFLPSIYVPGYDW